MINIIRKRISTISKNDKEINSTNIKNTDFFNHSFLTSLKHKIQNKKGYIDSVILTKTNKLILNRVYPDEKDTFAINNRSYYASELSIKHFNNRAYIFHFIDNPNPIIFNSNDNKITINATEYNIALKTKVLQDAFITPSENSLMLIITGITLAIVILTAFKQFGLIKIG